MPIRSGAFRRGLNMLIEKGKTMLSRGLVEAAGFVTRKGLPESLVSRALNVGLDYIYDYQPGRTNPTFGYQDPPRTNRYLYPEKLDEGWAHIPRGTLGPIRTYKPSKTPFGPMSSNDVTYLPSRPVARETFEKAKPKSVGLTAGGVAAGSHKKQRKAPIAGGAKKQQAAIESKQSAATERRERRQPAAEEEEIHVKPSKRAKQSVQLSKARESRMAGKADRIATAENIMSNPKDFSVPERDWAKNYLRGVMYREKKAAPKKAVVLV